MSNSKAESRPDLLLQQGSNNLPFILQTEAAECGLACLAMISGYYGFETDLTSIRHKYSISAHGATLKQIMSIAAKMELSTRALKLEVEQLSELQTPCILHWEMKHFVVLKKVTNKKVVIHDPAVGERSFSLNEVQTLFTGIALELSPTTSFEKGKEKNSLTLNHFWSRISGLKRSLTLVLFLSLFLQIFAIAHPYYIQIVIDDVILRSDLNLLTILAIGFGLLLLLETATGWLRELVILHLSSKLNIQMATNVFRHLIRLPMDYFAKRHMGDVVSRFESLNYIRELLTTGLITIVVDGLMAILTLIVMFIYSVKLTLFVITIVAIYALLRYVFYKPIKRLHEESIVANAKEDSHFMESIRAIQTVKLFGKESDRQSQWQNRLAHAMNKDIRIQKWNISFSTANKLLFGIENIVVIYLAAMAVTDSLLSVGMLYAFISYKTRFITSMDTLIEKWIEFRMLDLHFDRLADIVHTEKDAMTVTSDAEVLQMTLSTSDKPKGDISVKQLGFSYSELESAIFTNLDFEVSAGQTLAIVGRSGSGKSTLIKCVMGLLQPSDGHVLIDGKPMAQYVNYRQHIAAVMQDDQLLSGSIAENISCFDSTLNFEQVVDCAKLACVHEEIMATSMQYNTLVGDMGSSLSGGQKQRIVLARALYSQPSILFLDEATSNLDSTNEALINTHIKNLSITRVIIAHRPETFKSADIVLKLEDGKLSDITSQVKNP